MPSRLRPSNDPRIIEGRDFWPVPSSVRDNMQHIAKLSSVQADGGELATLKNIYFEVKNGRQADNKNLVVKAFEHYSKALQGWVSSGHGPSTGRTCTLC